VSAVAPVLESALESTLEAEAEAEGEPTIETNGQEPA
jgi:hypothetical protein